MDVSTEFRPDSQAASCQLQETLQDSALTEKPDEKTLLKYLLQFYAGCALNDQTPISPRQTAVTLDQNPIPEQKDVQPQEVRVGPPNQCPNCAKGFKTAAGLKQHLKRESITHHLCPCAGCTFVALNWQMLKDHMKINHKDNTFKCDKCGFSARTRHDLRYHIQATHLPKLPCHYCAQLFITQYHLARHERSCTGKPYKCPCAKKTFSTQAELEKHMLNHNRLVCPFEGCDYACIAHNTFKHHIKTFHSTKVAPSIPEQPIAVAAMQSVVQSSLP